MSPTVYHHELTAHGRQHRGERSRSQRRVRFPHRETGAVHPSDKQPQGFPCGSAGKEAICNVDSVPGLGRSPGEGKGSPLQYSGPENSTDCIVHGVTVRQTTTERLSHSIEMIT